MTVDQGDGIVHRVGLLEARIRNQAGARGVGGVREIWIHVDQDVADADAGDVAVEDIDATGVVLLAIVGEQHAEALVECVPKLEGVGVKCGVQFVDRAAPVLTARHDALRNADDWIAQRVHGVGAGGDRGADLDHR